MTSTRHYEPHRLGNVSWEPVFRVYNTKLRRWMTTKDFSKLAHRYNLIYTDVEDFYVSRDGTLLLVDECGNHAYMPPEFEVVLAEHYKTHPKADHNLEASTSRGDSNGKEVAAINPPSNQSKGGRKNE